MKGEERIAPPGWVVANVETVSSEIISGSGFPKEHQGDSTGEYPFAKVGDISKAFRAKQKCINSANHYISEKTRKEINAKIFPNGSIVFPKIGEALKGNYRLVTSREMLFDNNVMGIVPDTKLINVDFFFYFLNTQDFGQFAVATAVPSVRRGDIAAIPLPLPPLNEQHRIVGKIEELFSELDKGIENLKTAQAQLKVYRQALLKHAFEGKLTAQWREQNRDQLESAAALLARIQTEREQRYQQQLQQWQKSPSVPLLQRGKTTSTATTASVPHFEKGGLGGISKPKAPKPLPPLTPEELAELPELPEGWGWVRFGEVFNVYVGSTPSRKRADFWGGNISWVSSGEVAFCRIKETKEKITILGYESASTEIHPVGTVMLAMIGEGKTRGQAAILDIEASHNQNTAAIRVSKSSCSPEYVYQYLAYQYEITRKIGSGNNQKALNKERVSDLILPFCSIVEMNEIVRCLDEKLSIADQLDQTLTTALQQTEALRQSILKRAFSGQLVAQNADDEPAAALLARIRAERATAKDDLSVRQRRK